MRTINISGSKVSGVAYVPDATAYAFNPNYIEFSLNSFTGLVKVKVEDESKSYTIDVTVYKGSAKCYISRLLQVLFDDYVNTRSKEVDVHIYQSDDVQIGSFSSTVLWASVEAGMQYGYYLPMVSDRNGAGRQMREIVWFKKFPFKVSMLGRNGIIEMSADKVSDPKITLIPDNSYEGTYLRWIDCYGFWQYYLFDEGTRTSKNKNGSTSVDAEYQSGGQYHQAVRSSHVENTDTLKCCAVNMRREILAYVETIFKSPHIELYVGKMNREEIWKPVTLESGSVNIAADRKLYDYEITIALPQTQVQEI